MLYYSSASQILANLGAHLMKLKHASNRLVHFCDFLQYTTTYMEDQDALRLCHELTQRWLEHNMNYINSKNYKSKMLR